MTSILILLLLGIHWGSQVSAQGSTAGTLPKYRSVCYTEGWQHWRQDNLQYEPEDIDTSLCTHLVYQFAEPDPTGNHIIPHDSGDPSMYWRMTALRSRGVKVMLNVGGYGVGSDEFTQTVSSTGNMQNFAANALRFLNRYNFDGMDLDWEFPGDRGSPPEDKERFVQLLQIMQQAFSNNNGRPLILSISMNPSQYRINMSYKLPDIANYVDFINLMAFGLHGTWEGQVGHHSSLQSPTDDETDSIDYMVNWILQASVPRQKLNLGLPMYGIMYNLTDPTQYQVGAPTQGQPDPSEFFGSTYNMHYNEICHLMQEHNDTITASGRLPGTNAPFIVDGHRWTGYDDQLSLQEKVDYAIEKGLGGVAIVSIDMDDFNNLCGGGEYPLLHAIQQRLTQPPVGR